MLETNDFGNKDFERESHRIAGHSQLKQYGAFLEKYHQDLVNFENNFSKDVNYLESTTNLIDIQFDAWEEITILQLVQSDNKIFSKVIASLASVCEEAKLLVKGGEEQFYNELLFYGKDCEVNGKTNYENLSKLLELLQNICGSIKWARELITLIIKQLLAITSKDSKIPIRTSNIFYMDVCESLADILVYLETIESLLNNPVIRSSWHTFKRISRTAQHSQRTFQLPLDQLRAFDKLLYQIETTLLSDKIFQNTIEVILDHKFTKNTNLADAVSLYMTNILNELEKSESRVGESSVDLELEKNDFKINRTQNWLRINMLTVFHFHLFGNADKKYIKHLLEYNKKMCAATLVGNLLWYPEQFLMRHIPKLLHIFDERYVQATTTQRQTYLTNKSLNILKETLQLCHQTCSWIFQLEKKIGDGKMSKLNLTDCQERCNIFAAGITLGHEILENIKWITNIHAAEGKPINRTVLMCIFRLNSLIKGIQYTFQVYSDKINYCIRLIVQCLQFQILASTSFTRQSMTQDKSYKDANLDVLTALKIAEKALNGPPTNRRLLIIQLSLAATVQSTDYYFYIRNRLHHINILVNLSKQLHNFGNVSFLYWHQMLVHVYFQSIFDAKTDLGKVLYTFYGINDCCNSLKDEDAAQFLKNIDKSFESKFILPICQTIEVNLRLQTHAHLQVAAPNVFESGIAPFQTLLQMQPIQLSDYFVSIKAHTEHYLSTTFYNLATVVLHDWHTYGEMRRLAHFKHNLETVEDYLPNQTIEQGLDALEIMRNIHVFVSKYLYNLNNQVFIEQASNNKHLNTINIRHLANSIRMHGIGIMNTTVNFTYQFLRKKFLSFSQFMFDEQIKSRLIKDIRFFRENKAELDQMYPFERAEKFNLAIRKLGVTPLGESFLDLFRLLISHIGNAMGYIRMIRSGGRHFCANAIAYLPDLESEYNFEYENCSEQTEKCTQKLLKQIETLREHFDEKTEYFKLLVEVFAPVFRNPQNMHLKNFYAIIPPLTINFVEHSLTCRDRLNKKNKVGASFTDDGFAMGLAYILKLLEQGSEMSSLHWFQSVRVKYTQEQLALQKQKGDFHDDKLQQTLALTEKRIQRYQQEFDLLYYNLNSATIFFQ